MVPLILAAASIGSQGVSLFQAHKAKKLAKGEAAIEQAIQAEELAKRKRDITDRARAYVATAMNAAEQLGAGASSGVVGQSGAVVSSGAGDISQYNSTFEANSRIASLETKRQNAMYRGQQWQLAGSIFDKGAEVTGGYGDLAAVFGYSPESPGVTTSKPISGRNVPSNPSTEIDWKTVDLDQVWGP